MSEPQSQPPPPLPPPGPKPARDFTTLYQATVTPLRRYLARLLGNTSEAQDIAHDAYLRLYPTLKDQSAEQPEALLYVTARRLLYLPEIELLVSTFRWNRITTGAAMKALSSGPKSDRSAVPRIL